MQRIDGWRDSTVEASTAAGWPFEKLAPIEHLPTIETTELNEFAEDEIHIWYCHYDRVLRDDRVAAYAALMTPDETALYGRFRFEDDRREYLMTRAVVRSVLSRYTPVSPADLRFVRDEYNKPFVAAPVGLPCPSFNLSNTRGLIACVIGKSGSVVGVDVENTDCKGESVSIADHYFSPFEVRALRALPAPLQRERFLCYWTLKESYIKARGLGFSIPLDQFSFHLDEGPEISISFDPRLEDDAGTWKFTLLRVSPSHLLAVAQQRPSAARPTLRAAHIVPLDQILRGEQRIGEFDAVVGAAPVPDPDGCCEQVLWARGV